MMTAIEKEKKAIEIYDNHYDFINDHLNVLSTDGIVSSIYDALDISDDDKDFDDIYYILCRYIDNYKYTLSL